MSKTHRLSQFSVSGTGNGRHESGPESRFWCKPDPLQLPRSDPLPIPRQMLSGQFHHVKIMFTVHIHGTDPMNGSGKCYSGLATIEFKEGNTKQSMITQLQVTRWGFVTPKTFLLSYSSNVRVD